MTAYPYLEQLLITCRFIVVSDTSVLIATQEISNYNLNLVFKILDINSVSYIIVK